MLSPHDWLIACVPCASILTITANRCRPIHRRTFSQSKPSRWFLWTDADVIRSLQVDSTHCTSYSTHVATMRSDPSIRTLFTLPSLCRFSFLTFFSLSTGIPPTRWRFKTRHRVSTPTHADTRREHGASAEADALFGSLPI